MSQQDPFLYQQQQASHHDDLIHQMNITRAMGEAKEFLESTTQWCLSNNLFCPSSFLVLWPGFFISSEPVPFGLLVQVLTEISATPTRLGSLRHLTEFFLALLLRHEHSLANGTDSTEVATVNTKTTPTSSRIASSNTLLALEQSLYLILGSLGPAHLSLKLGLGDATLTEVVSELTGRQLNNKRGIDLSQLARDLTATQSLLFAPTDGRHESQPTSVSISRVFDTLQRIAKASGQGSQRERKRQILTLLHSVPRGSAEVTVLMRLLSGKLQIGVQLSTILHALGCAFGLLEGLRRSQRHCWTNDMKRIDSENLGGDTAVEEVEDTDVVTHVQTSSHNSTTTLYHWLKPFLAGQPPLEYLQKWLSFSSELFTNSYYSCPVFATLLSCFTERPLTTVEPPGLTLSVPVMPMLAHATRSLSEAIGSFKSHQSILCEYKYDGERCQIHFQSSVTNLSHQKQKMPAIWLYSRGSESQNYKFKEILPSLAEGLAPEVFNCVLDGEVVAVGNDDRHEILPFQLLQRRERTDASLKRSREGNLKQPTLWNMMGIQERLKQQEIKRVNLKESQRPKPTTCHVFVFDLLWLNDQSLLQTSLWMRRCWLFKALGLIPFTEMNNRPEGKELEQLLKKRSPDLVLQLATGMTLRPAMASVDPTAICTESIESRNSPIAESVTELSSVKQTLPDPSHPSSVVDPRIKSLASFFDSSLRDKCEGLMLKSLSSHYQPFRRSTEWLKLKKEYAGLTETLDLIVVGGFHGKGKRTGVFGAFLLASWDERREMAECVCKVGSGLSDAQLELLGNQLEVIKDKPSQVVASLRHGNHQEMLKPDVWFEPTSVWEVQVADLTLSSLYPAASLYLTEEALGLTDRSEENRNNNNRSSSAIQSGKGISVRFPTFIRVRNDKTIAMATTSEQLVRLFKSQGKFKRIEHSRV